MTRHNGFPVREMADGAPKVITYAEARIINRACDRFFINRNMQVFGISQQIKAAVARKVSVSRESIAGRPDSTQAETKAACSSVDTQDTRRPVSGNPRSGGKSSKP